MSHKFDELEFVPIVDPNIFKLIPRKLFEQVKHREWEVDNLYKYGPLFITNPFNRFWVLTDVANVIKGILWITIDPLIEIIIVSMLTVDKEYQMNGEGLRCADSKILKKTKEHLHEFREELKEKGGVELKEKILWSTTCPKPFERIGGRRTKRITMEI